MQMKRFELKIYCHDLIVIKHSSEPEHSSTESIYLPFAWRLVFPFSILVVYCRFASSMSLLLQSIWHRETIYRSSCSSIKGPQRLLRNRNLPCEFQAGIIFLAIDRTDHRIETKIKPLNPLEGIHYPQTYIFVPCSSILCRHWNRHWFTAVTWTTNRSFLSCHIDRQTLSIALHAHSLFFFRLSSVVLSTSECKIQPGFHCHSIVTFCTFVLNTLCERKS